MADLTHFNEKGEAVMVDIHEKYPTYRVAKAMGRIYVNEQVMNSIINGDNKKGDVLGIARIAGIMGAKKNCELIPLCHNIGLTNCKVDFSINQENNYVQAICEASCVGKTGVEMEALTGVTISLLTIYDMCKAIDKTMKISDVTLLEKDGGKSGHFVNNTLK
ncbi:MAG: cyclic pyranopterin monophosphate synthase MoaC [Lachnospiraceae bacterium]|jgi:cyclic pyranopterin phosphate synthase|nr:cyclic pyranopterin monophosphate synthase MoaC [Lachnospiraceae bacterium]